MLYMNKEFPKRNILESLWSSKLETKKKDNTLNIVKQVQLITSL